jgi:hypothetical protein
VGHSAASTAQSRSSTITFLPSTGHFKNFLSGKRFEEQTALKKIVVHYLTSFGKEHYHEEMLKLGKCWDKSLNANGDHVEK